VMVVVLILLLLLLFPLLHSIQTPRHCARQCLSPSFEEELQDIDSKRNRISSSSSHQSVSCNSCKKKLQLSLPVLTRMIRICEKHGPKWRKTKNTRTHTHIYFFHYKLHKSSEKIHSRMFVNQGREIYRVSDLCS
jgi:hypothetical protein